MSRSQANEDYLPTCSLDWKEPYRSLMEISLGRQLGCIFPEAWPNWANHSHQLGNGRGDVSREVSRKAALTAAGNREQWEFRQPGRGQNGGAPGNDKKQTEQREVLGGGVGSG